VATRLTEAEAGSVPGGVAAVAYRPGARVAAQALAGDLGMTRGSVVRVDDVPRKLVVVADP
jgi:hypothetical protein